MSSSELYGLGFLIAASAALHYLLRNRYRYRYLRACAVVGGMSGVFLLVVVSLVVDQVSNIWPIACMFYCTAGFLIAFVTGIPSHWPTPNPPPSDHCPNCGHNLTGKSYCQISLMTS